MLALQPVSPVVWITLERRDGDDPDSVRFVEVDDGIGKVVRQMPPGVGVDPAEETRRRTGRQDGVRQDGVRLEWRLDKAQNFLIEGPATFRIRELGTHDLAGEAAHRGEECFGAAMFGDGFVEPIGLFLGER